MRQDTASGSCHTEIRELSRREVTVSINGNEDCSIILNAYTFSNFRETLMIQLIKQQLIQRLLAEMPNLVPNDTDFSISHDINVADITIRSFLIAKKLQVKPKDAAAQISTYLYNETMVSRIDTIGPYVNIFFNRKQFFECLLSEFDGNSSFGSSSIGKGKRALIEHTSITPSARPNIVRIRCSIVGDFIARLFKFHGYHTDVHYFVNDLAKEIALLAIEIENATNRESISFNDMIDIYAQSNEKLKFDESHEQKALSLLVDFENRVPSATKDFNWIVSKCLEGQLAILSRMGIYFDHFDKESRFINDKNVEFLITRLRKQHAIFIDEYGREVLDLLKIGFKPSSGDVGRFLVLRRANGSCMYAYRDIAYCIMKHELNRSANVVVLGQDHKMYFQQISTVLSVVNIPQPEPIYYSFVFQKNIEIAQHSDPDFVLNEMKSKAMILVRDSNPLMDDSEIASIAEIISIGAIKFSILSALLSKNINFDWDLAMSFSGDTGPYIQYSCARILSLFEKIGETPKTFDFDMNTIPDIENIEWELILTLAYMPSRVFSAFQERDSTIITTYALDIAKAFSRFYKQCPITNAQSDVRMLRLVICKITYTILEKLLNILGIDVPSRM